uniref:Uncharacterized protein n=1 Tax=Mesocestoides corti TaxID=53468 RepID=A0A5K3FSQ1_MESCO
MGDSRSSTPLAEETDSNVDDLHLTDNVTTAAGTAQQLQIPQPPWYVQFRQMLARLRIIFFSLMARLEPTSDVEEADAVCTAILAYADAYRELRRTAWELAMAKQTL